METQSVYAATGRRKEASAQVRMKPGSGAIIVNTKKIEDYFPREITRMIIRQPLEITNTLDRFNINVNVRGGGASGQASGSSGTAYPAPCSKRTPI